MVQNTNFYRYIIERFNIIFSDNSVVSLSHGEIVGLSIEKDFDECFYPLLNVKLLLGYGTYYKIIENKTTVKFNIKLSKYITDKQGIDSDASSRRFLEPVFDCTFGIYTDENISSMDKSLYEKTLNTIGEQDLAKTVYDIYLFKDGDITIGKTTINDILTESNMTDALMYLFTNAGINKLLMSPLDNSEKITEVVIPYIPLTQAINFLEQHYGFYKSGSLFFLDFDKAYFIAKYGKQAYTPNEYYTAVIQVFKPGKDGSKSPGCYKDNSSKKLIIHVSHDKIVPTTESIIQEQISGTNVAVIDTSTDNIVDINPDVMTRSGTTTRVVVNKFENPFINNMTLFNKLQNDKVIDAVLVDIDVNFLQPNKTYIFTFEDPSSQKLYAGTYRLCRYSAVFSKEGEYFSSSIETRFKTVNFNF